MENPATYTAFVGPRQLASGAIQGVLVAARRHLDAAPHGSTHAREDERAPLLIFSDQTGAQLEFDLRGSEAEVLARLQADPDFASACNAPPAARSGPGRPKLGVVSREVSLLPRHWAWLERQPGGASGSLRRLVEVAQKSGQRAERARNARDAAGKFMWSMAGNLPDFEEVSRALYAGDQARLEQLIGGWPEDIRAHVQKLTREAARLAREAAAQTAPP